VSTSRRSSSLFARLTALAALALLPTTCGEEKPFECKSPAECVGRPSVNTCKVVGGKGRCVIGCVSSGGSHNCPPNYTCGGMADDGSNYCI
jgi:hypothetical protein